MAQEKGKTAVQKLRAGGKILGSMMRIVKSPAIAHIAANSGLDMIMLDMEHSAYSMEDLSRIAMVARSISLGIFVRVPELTKGYVSRAMDCGAEGVMVPMIETREQAEKLVNWTRYAPLGKRGIGSSGVHTAYTSVSGQLEGFIQQSNRDTLSIAQIESEEAIKNIEKIASVKGLDALLIGPNDLSISLGIPGEILHEEVQTSIVKVRDAARKHQLIFGIHAGEALLDLWVQEGLQLIMNSLDVNVLLNGFKNISQKYTKEVS